MNIQKIETANLRESEFNPRIKLDSSSKEYKMIADSISEFDLVEPLVVNDVNMSVIGGHQRLQVLKDMEVAEVECVLVHIEEPEREKALCVALNKISGDWDMEKLALLLSDENVSVFPTGFYDGEIDLDAYLPDDDTELPFSDDGEGEEQEADAEQPDDDVTTIIKIGSFSFPVKASEYYGLLDDIRDSGIFEPAAIREELKRRILTGDETEEKEGMTDD